QRSQPRQPDCSVEPSTTFSLPGWRRRLRSRLNCQRDFAAGFLIEDDISTGFCGSNLLNPRLVSSRIMVASSQTYSPFFILNISNCGIMKVLQSESNPSC